MSAPVRVLITDHPWPDLEIERGILEAAGAEVIEAPRDDEATLAGLAAEATAIATCWAQVTERVLSSAPHCRLVARMGIGLDNIDVAAAGRPIPVLSSGTPIRELM